MATGLENAIDVCEDLCRTFQGRQHIAKRSDVAAAILDRRSSIEACASAISRSALHAATGRPPAWAPERRSREPDSRARSPPARRRPSRCRGRHCPCAKSPRRRRAARRAMLPGASRSKLGLPERSDRSGRWSHRGSVDADASTIVLPTSPNSRPTWTILPAGR